MTTLRIGISGFGGAGPHAAAVYRSLPDCRVVAIHDPRPAGRDRAARVLPDVLFTEDFEALLGSGIDVLAVCSPMHVHAVQILRGLAEGKHVICEPPLTTTADDCAAILRAARAHPDLIVRVQRLVRFIPLHLAMRRTVAGGELGRITYVEANWVEDMRQRLTRHDDWAMTRPVTPFLLGGFQAVDLLQWILDDRIEEVVAGMGGNTAWPVYREADLGAVLVRFRSGAIGRIVSAIALGRPQDTSIRIFGDRQCIENNLLLQADGTRRELVRPILRQRRSPTASLRRRLGNLWRDLRWNSGAVVAHRLVTLAARLCHPASGYSVSSYPFRLHEHGTSLKACLLDFVGAIRTGQRSLVSLLEASRTVAASLACAEACRTGRTVPVQEFVRPEFADEPVPS